MDKENYEYKTIIDAFETEVGLKDSDGNEKITTEDILYMARHMNDETEEGKKIKDFLDRIYREKKDVLDGFQKKIKEEK